MVLLEIGRYFEWRTVTGHIHFFRFLLLQDLVLSSPGSFHSHKVHLLFFKPYETFKTSLGLFLSLGNSSSVQFSSLAQLWLLPPHRLQHARLPCPSPTLRACSNSCPLSQWCHPTISILCRPLLLLPSIFPSIRVFSNESVLYIRWPKYWSFSFSISPSSKYSGMISFRMEFFLGPFIFLFHAALKGNQMPWGNTWCKTS